jgi:ribosome-associated protein YbcJ (S4-like RNA binding protein)
VYNISNIFVINVVLLLLIISASLPAKASSDPTKPLFGHATSQVAKTQSRLVLQSVISSGNQYKAVINGQIVKKNEAISGYKIKEITPGKVVLASQNKRIVLSLFTQDKFTKVIKR